MDQIKQQRTTTINNWKGKTYCCTYLSHLTRPSCWCRRWTRNNLERLLCLGGERRKGQMWNGPNKTTRTTRKKKGKMKGRRKVRCENRPNKTTRCHHYQHLARQDLLRAISVTLDTTHWLMSPLNAAAPKKAVVCLGEGRRKVRCENGPNKTTKDHNYQHLARQDLLRAIFVTLDTTHLLMSALNAAAFWKAVVFGRRKKKV